MTEPNQVSGPEGPATIESMAKELEKRPEPAAEAPKSNNEPVNNQPKENTEVKTQADKPAADPADQVKKLEQEKNELMELIEILGYDSESDLDDDAQKPEPVKTEENTAAIQQKTVSPKSAEAMAKLQQKLQENEQQIAAIRATNFLKDNLGAVRQKYELSDDDMQSVISEMRKIPVSDEKSALEAIALATKIVVTDKMLLQQRKSMLQEKQKDDNKPVRMTVDEAFDRLARAL